MTFARWTFRLASIYGLIVMLPLYFLERRIGAATPPAITHPEYFYGFIGAVCAMQLVYFIISTDPVRYRALMPVGVLAKLGFLIPNTLLWVQGRVWGGPVAFSAVDLLLALLFAASFVKTRQPGVPG